MGSTRAREQRRDVVHRETIDRGETFTERLSRSVGGGSPLAQPMRRELEQTFDSSFADVRVHADSESAALAGALDARAFTVGSDMFFATGGLSPDTDAGWQLLVHEATHVAQHQSASDDGRAFADGAVVVPHADATELEARQNADRATFADGSPVTQRASARAPSEAGVTINRDGPDIDYKLLPPSLKVGAGPLSVSGDTKGVGADLSLGRGSLGFNYGYGGDMSLSGGYGPMSGGLSLEGGDLSLSGKYKAGDLTLRGGVTPGTGAFNAGLSLGAPLLPMPWSLGGPMNAAGSAVPGLVSGLPGALDDPMGFYKANADQISALSAAGGKLSSIAGGGDANGLKFGAGLNVGYDPAKHDWRVMAGVQGSF